MDIIVHPYNSSYADPLDLKNEHRAESPPYGIISELPERSNKTSSTSSGLICCTAAKAAKRTYAVHY